MKRTTYLAGLLWLLLIAAVAIAVQTTVGGRGQITPAMHGTVDQVEECQ